MDLVNKTFAEEREKTVNTYNYIKTKNTFTNVVAEPRRRLAWFKTYVNDDDTYDGESGCGGRCVQAGR